MILTDIFFGVVETTNQSIHVAYTQLQQLEKQNQVNIADIDGTLQ